MKQETKELVTKATKIGRSLAMSQGRIAVAFERLAQASETIAEKLTALIELAAAASIATPAITTDEMTAGLAATAELELAASQSKKKKKKTNSEKGAKNAG